MRKILILLLTIGSLGFSQDVNRILENAEKAFKVDKLYSLTEVRITKNGNSLPVQVVEGFSTTINGENNSLSVYQSPKKMKGNANLMIGDNLWVKFASTGRVRKLSSSAKKNSSGGSDFSYVDMGSGNDGISSDYNSKLLGEVKINGESCFEIELTPTKSNETGYEKLMVYIATESIQYREIHYFEDGANIKKLYLSDYRDLGDFTYPYLMEMVSNVKDSSTVIETLEIELNSSRVEDSLFTQSYLKKIK